jgi:cytoskeletal protein CcmA (bactofilin family)
VVPADDPALDLVAEPGAGPEGEEEEAGIPPASVLPAQEEPVTAAREDSQFSVFSRGTKIEGTIMAAGPLRIEGEVTGEIHAKGEVSLSPQGRVHANIEASSITLAGIVKGDLQASGDVSLPAESRLEGNIRARNADVGGAVRGDIVVDGRAVLGPRARVQGDITSKALAIAEGAVFIGRSLMGDERDTP